MIYQSFSKRQILALTWWNRPELKEKDAIVCDGAVRAGKTLCMAGGFILWAMATFHGEVFGLCGKTVASLRRNVVRNLPNWLGGLGIQIVEKRSDSKLEIYYAGKMNTFYLFGGKDESSAALIQGITLAGILMALMSLCAAYISISAAACIMFLLSFLMVSNFRVRKF